MDSIIGVDMERINGSTGFSFMYSWFMFPPDLFSHVIRVSKLYLENGSVKLHK